MARIRVMLIEADYFSRYALCSLLSKDARTAVVDEARDVEEARWLLEANCRQVSPEVILLGVDHFREERDPVEALKGLVEDVRHRVVSCKIVCYSMEPTLAFIRTAVGLGVDAIAKTDEVADRIADVVEKVHQGYFVYTHSVSERAFGRLQGVRHSQCWLMQLPPVILPDRRLLRVARLYCEYNLTAAELAEILHLSESGVRRRIRQVYRVLGVHNRREARSKLWEVV